jgi:16S rRNA processing protein RimM
MVLVGRIGRPHGIRGHVFVNAETDFVEQRFAPGARLWLKAERGEETLTVASLRVQGGRPVLSFEGLTRIEDVERLTGAELRVPERMLQALDEGFYYEHQLVGCAVETTDGPRIGVVTRVDGGAGGSLLAVAGARGEILIPFAADICVAVDVAAKVITIRPPEGLLELNDR